MVVYAPLFGREVHARRDGDRPGVAVRTGAALYAMTQRAERAAGGRSGGVLVIYEGSRPSVEKILER